MATYYDILEIPINSTADEVKRAYHRLVLIHHPDKTAHLPPHERDKRTILFREIQAAYEVLYDVTKRTAYDNAMFPGTFQPNPTAVPDNRNPNPWKDRNTSRNDKDSNKGHKHGPMSTDSREGGSFKMEREVNMTPDEFRAYHEESMKNKNRTPAPEEAETMSGRRGGQRFGPPNNSGRATHTTELAAGGTPASGGVSGERRRRQERPYNAPFDAEPAYSSTYPVPTAGTSANANPTAGSEPGPTFYGQGPQESTNPFVSAPAFAAAAPVSASGPPFGGADSAYANTNAHRTYLQTQQAAAEAARATEEGGEERGEEEGAEMKVKGDKRRSRFGKMFKWARKS
ncbi:DnaJ-domain-containing protein [Massarina eburnea CBS 473.64]|uniref:DnaJ-domain-containing protein n=1 Tax=Massarina eburnea CBS 473.64 TaxID=1395130 RepID=A0A6A6S403_9PLEO|nr:DnaJ-domain-containing protein [Massarina eburnea CBS 473.64]